MLLNSGLAGKTEIPGLSRGRGQREEWQPAAAAGPYSYPEHTTSMAENEVWERPIGLTKECAICIDDSDDDSRSSPAELSKAGKGTQCPKSCNASSTYFQDRGAVVSTRGSCGAGSKTSGISINTATNTLRNGLEMIFNEDKSPQAVASPTGSPVEKGRVKCANPFAHFAFVAGDPTPPSSARRKRTRENPPPSTIKCSARKSQTKKKHVAGVHPFFSKTLSARNANQPLVQSAGVKTQQQTREVRETKSECIEKWQAFADPSAPLEQRRFQVLVAARLHARCQEPVVKEAMQRLRKHFDGVSDVKNDCCDDVEDESCKTTTLSTCHNNSTGSAPQSQSEQKNIATPSHHSTGLTVQSLASSIPETDIAPLFSSVLFGNVKAKQIVQASQDIIAKFGGMVPESICSLKQITGIGPKLAEILYIVNRRRAYQS